MESISIKVNSDDSGKVSAKMTGFLANNDYRTALMWACINGHTEIVNILIDNGANLTRTDRSGTNCLFCAADSDNPSTVKSVLQQNKIPVNLHNPSGWTVLHKLSAVNDVESSSDMVKILVENGANVNLRDNNGNTPVSEALWRFLAATPGAIWPSGVETENLTLFLDSFGNNQWKYTYGEGTFERKSRFDD